MFHCGEGEQHNLKNPTSREEQQGKLWRYERDGANKNLWNFYPLFYENIFKLWVLNNPQIFCLFKGIFGWGIQIDGEVFRKSKLPDERVKNTFCCQRIYKLNLWNLCWKYVPLPCITILTFGFKFVDLWSTDWDLWFPFISNRIITANQILSVNEYDRHGFWNVYEVWVVFHSAVISGYV